MPKCTPGYNQERKTHHWVFTWDGKTALMPRGGHGKNNPEIEIGHIKHMIRLLEIDTECVREKLSQMKGVLKKKDAAPVASP